MIRRILSWHRARQARLHAPLVPEPDLRVEVRELMKQAQSDNRALSARVKLLEQQFAQNDNILSREFAGLGKVMTRSAKLMIPDEEDLT